MKNTFAGGVIIIVIGIAFLLMNFDVIELGNRWWTLFLLIPIGSMGADLWNRWQRNGKKYSPDMSGSLIGLLSVSTVMIIFVFHLHWGMMWPLFIIIAGISVFLSGKK